VSGVDERFFRKLQQPPENRLVLGARIAVLEVGAPGAADEQRIAGEDPVIHAEAVGVVGVARRVEHLELEAFDGETVAIRDAHRDHVDPAALAHHGDAMGTVAQRAETGDVIGMQVSVDRLDELQIELAQQLQVPLHPLDHRVDEQRLPAAPAGEQVGVGARGRIEQLPEDHAPRPPERRSITCPPRSATSGTAPVTIASRPGSRASVTRCDAGHETDAAAGDFT